jgi:hypothetical protein
MSMATIEDYKRWYADFERLCEQESEDYGHEIAWSSFETNIAKLKTRAEAEGMVCSGIYPWQSGYEFELAVMS